MTTCGWEFMSFMPSCLQFLMLEDRLGVVEAHFGNSRLLRFALLGFGIFFLALALALCTSITG